jgi:hypothetical protein
VIRPSRSSRALGRRGLALWLVVAQVILFAASGLTHFHASPIDATAPAVGACLTADTPGLQIRAAEAAAHGAASDCALCQTIRSSVADLALAPCVLSWRGTASHAILPESRGLLTTPLRTSSPRAPPIS